MEVFREVKTIINSQDSNRECEVKGILETAVNNNRIISTNVTCSTLKYSLVRPRSSVQSALKPMRIMLGESLPRPARVRQDLAPSSKVLLSVTV